MLSLEALLGSLFTQDVAILLDKCGRAVLCDPEGVLDVAEHLAFDAYRTTIERFFMHMIGCQNESDQHMAFLHQYKTMPYKQYLQTAHWKVLRRTKLLQANRRCQICNREDKLQIHHRTYERLGQEHLSDLTALCGSCHAMFHKKLAKSDSQDNS